MKYISKHHILVRYAELSSNIIENIRTSRYEQHYTSQLACDNFNSLYDLFTDQTLLLRNKYKMIALHTYTIHCACKHLEKHLHDNMQYWITQESFDALIKLLSLDIFVHAFSSARNTISAMLYLIITCYPDLCYDNAYAAYDKYMHAIVDNEPWDYDKKKEFEPDAIPINERHPYMTFLRNKTLPLSEADSLHILQYPYIANVLFINNNNIFTITDTVLCAIIAKSHINIISHYRHQIINSSTNTDKYMDSMIIFGDMELLQRYINHNAIEYNVAHLMRACATLNIELVHEITNNKVLPNKECVDALLSNLPDPIIECYNCHNAKHSAKNKRDIAAQQQKYGIIRNIMMMCIRCGYHVTGDNIDAMKKHGIDMHVCNKVSD